MKLIWEQDMFSSWDEFENVAFCCTAAGACWSLMVSLSDAVVGRRAVTMRITKCCDSCQSMCQRPSCQSMCQRPIWCVHNSPALLTMLVLVGCYQTRSRSALLTVLVLLSGYQARSRSALLTVLVLLSGYQARSRSALLTVLVLLSGYQARSRSALLTVLVLLSGYRARSRSTMQILWKCQNCFFLC